MAPLQSPVSSLPPPRESIADRYDVERIVERLGYSRFNVVVCLVAIYMTMLGMINIVVVAFTVYIPPDVDADFCNERKDYKSDESDISYPSHLSFMLESNLACDWPVVANLASALFFLGGLGSFVGLSLADKFGRRPSIVLFHAAACALHALTYFVQDPVTYLAFRFLGGFTQVCGFYPAVVLLNESFSASRRYNVYLLMALSDPFCYGIVSLSSYLLPNWRFLHLVVSALFLIGVFLAGLLPESLRWLSAQNDEFCQRRLESLAKGALKLESLQEFEREEKKDQGKDDEVAKDTPTIEILPQTSDAVGNENKNPWLSRELWRRLLPVSFFWVTFSATFWSINLSSSDLMGGDRYLNFALLGLMQLPSMALAALLGNFLSRRGTLAAFFAGTSICFGVNCAVRAMGASPEDAKVFASTLVGRFFAGGTLLVTELLTTECFPTHIRSRCVGVSVASGRLATCAASFASLAVRATPTVYPATVATLNAVAVGVVWTIKETKDAAMPQTMEEMLGGSGGREGGGRE